MKSTGIVRGIDALGRIVLPKELRTSMHLDTDTKLEIFVDGDAIVLKKHRPAGSCDFCGEVDEQALQELERAANEAVWADFAPHIWYPEPDELAHLPYRSKKALTGAVRLVQFGDIDLCACCGTHVARTG